MKSQKEKTVTDKERIAQLESALLSIEALNSGYHACKNIRAWAAEANQDTKAAIRRIIAEVSQ